MRLEIFPGVSEAARRAAAILAAEARAAAAARGLFTLAVSGGRTPDLMLRALAAEAVPWDSVHLFQTDERVAPEGSEDRNLTRLREALLSRVCLPAGSLHPMPVEAVDLQAAAAEYARKLEVFAGTPPVLDLVHLGLGPDGHTASLFPGDPALEVSDRDVTLSGPRQGLRRMTLTLPVLGRARRLLWLVTGQDKAEMLGRLLDGDPSIPAGQVRRGDAIVVADRVAAGRRDLSRASKKGSSL